MKNAMNKVYEDVEFFNDVAGNLTGVDKASIAAQLDFIQEEYLETVAAFDDEDPVELLDGVADLIVTVFGLAQKLEASGYNVSEAVQRVCVNNNSKYVPKGQPLRYNSEHTASLNQTYGVWVIKDKNLKIKKHSLFEEVDIVDCAPTEFFKEAP